MKKFILVERFLGYRTKSDKTATPSGYLVSPSKNVLINDAEKLATREGYELDGDANAALTPVESSFDWKTSRGTERNLRAYDDELECRYIDSDGNVNWVRVANGWSAVDFHFTKWWDTTEDTELLIFVVGNANIYEWGGGIAEVDSITGTTITKKGTPTWKQAGFYSTRNKTLVCVRTGTEYVYTGGETSDTLTGIGSTAGLVAGDILVQKIVTNSNSPAAGVVNDFVGTLNNQLYVGSETANEVYVSRNTAYATFTFSSPRLPGEGELLTLDSPGVGLAPLDQDMIVFAGESDIYATQFEQLDVGGTLTETLKVKKLNTGPGMSAFSRDFIETVGNTIVYLTKNKTLESFDRPAQLELTNRQTLSDLIKPDFDAATWTGGHIRAQKNRIYLSDAANSRVYITETRPSQDKEGKALSIRFWQPPQVLPIRRFAIIGGALYGHSNAVPETYELFTGRNDNSQKFAAVAALAYENYGERVTLKDIDEWYTEGYISPNTALLLTLSYELDGAVKKNEKEISGADAELLFQPVDSGSLGDNPLGDAPLGDQPSEQSDLPKFRHIAEFAAEDFHEIQATYSSDAIDARWELLAVGGNARKSPNQPISIKR